MAFSKQKRKLMEDTIYTFFTKLDPTGKNTKKYKDFFGKMSDGEFQKFFDKFFSNNRDYLTFDIIEWENNLTMNNINDAAKFLGVPLYEYVMMPSVDEESGKVITTSRRVPVGYIHMKTVQQMARKKNSTSIHADMRDPRTGQVSGDDKDVQVSAEENFSLLVYNAHNSLKELMSVRADDMVMKQEAYSAIRKNGYVSISELTDNISNKTALNTLNVYLTAMHIKSDVIGPSYLLDANKEVNV